jgi:hypothetical protein
LPYIEEDQDLDESTGRDTDHESLIQEIRRNFDSDMEYWGPTRAEGDIDMRYSAGDAWDPNERQSRTAGAPDTQRLCLSFDELNQNINQVVNNFRQNKPAIKIEPKGAGANDKTAELRGNKIREIEYKSNAVYAYTTAFDNMVRRSYGFYEICRDFENPKSFNQEIYIKSVPNPNCILPDPNGTEMDGSDWKRCFKLREYTHDEFRKKWPNAKTVSFGPDMMLRYPKWVTEKTIQVCEYWKVHEDPATLLALDAEIEIEGKLSSNLIPEEYPEIDFRVKNKTLYLDNEPIAMVIAKRPTVLKSVCQYIANGLEVLEENPQPGEYIPIIPMYGAELWLNSAGGSERRIMSLIRLARDPQTALSYLGTTQMELVGQIPKAPYIGYEGQFEGHTEEWAQVNRVRMAYLQVKPVLDATGNTVLPLPQQTHYEPAIQSVEVLRESMRRAVQSAMGISPLPTQALRRNEKSGIALQQIETNQQVGSYHFMDNAKMSIAHGGRIINSWLAATYDTKREIGVRKEDETHEIASNFDVLEEGMEEVNLFDVGEHDIVVGTGPSYADQRQQATDFADLLAQNPIAFPLLGPLIIKLKNLGPLGDQMAELMEYAQPPEVRAQEAAKKQGQAPVPPEAQAQIAQLTQALEVMKQAMLELEQKANAEQTKIQTTEITKGADLQKEQMSREAELAKVQMTLQAEMDRLDKQLATQKEIAAANNRTQITIKAMEQKSKADIAILNHEVEAIHKDLDIAAGAETLQLSHEQQMEAKQLEHEQGKESSAIQREQSAEDGEVSHERALEMKRLELEAKQKTLNKGKE